MQFNNQVILRVNPATHQSTSQSRYLLFSRAFICRMRPSITILIFFLLLSGILCRPVGTGFLDSLGLKAVNPSPTFEGTTPRSSAVETCYFPISCTGYTWKTSKDYAKEAADLKVAAELKIAEEEQHLKKRKEEAAEHNREAEKEENENRERHEQEIKEIFKNSGVVLKDPVVNAHQTTMHHSDHTVRQRSKKGVSNSLHRQKYSISIMRKRPHKKYT